MHHTCRYPAHVPDARHSVWASGTGLLQHEVRACDAGDAPQQDLHVGGGVAVDVGPHHDPVGCAHLPDAVGPCRRAAKPERLVARCCGIGVDRCKVDPVDARNEILDGILGGADRAVACGAEHEHIRDPIPRAATHEVGPGPADDPVGTAPPRDRVVAGPGIQDIADVVPYQVVVSVAGLHMGDVSQRVVALPADGDALEQVHPDPACIVEKPPREWPI